MLVQPFPETVFRITPGITTSFSSARGRGLTPPIFSFGHPCPWTLVDLDPRGDHSGERPRVGFGMAAMASEHVGSG